MAAPRADAALIHPYVAQYEGADTPSGQFVGPSDVTVDSQGAIYSSTFFNSEVAILDPTGHYITDVPFDSASGVAVDGIGDLYIVKSLGVRSNPGDVFKFVPSSFPVTSATTYTQVSVLDSNTARAIAVDRVTGDLFVDEGTRIVEYASNGTEVRTFGSFTESTAVAVDEASQAVYVLDFAKRVVKKFDSNGVAAEFSALGTDTLDGSGSTAGTFLAPTGLAVDQDTGHIFVIDRRIDAGDPEGSESVIDEFSASGGFVADIDPSQTPQGAFTFSSQHSGIAVASGSGRVYVTNYVGGKNIGGSVGGLINVFGPLVDAPDVTTDEAVAVHTSSAVLRGTVNPNGQILASCEFEYGETEAYGQTAACSTVDGQTITGPSQIPADNIPHSVTATPTDLVIGHVYHFRLVTTTNFGPTVATSQGKDLKVTALGPRIQGEQTSRVTDTAAVLEATINPNGVETSYIFQYVSASDYQSSGFQNATTVPGSPVSVGSSDSDVPVQQEIFGLSPASSYIYRVVALSECEPGVQCRAEGEANEASGGAEILRKLKTYGSPQGSAGCPNEALRGGASAFLSDCRAYELATPVVKEGTDVQNSLTSLPGAEDLFSVAQAAPQGNASTFEAETGLPGAEGAQEYGIFQARRSPTGDGWGTQGLFPPPAFGVEATVKGWSEDLSRTYLEMTDPGQLARLYERVNADHSMHLVATVGTPGVGGLGAQFIAATPDGSAMAFVSAAKLKPGAATGNNLYVWTPGAESLLLGSVLNSGQAPPKGTVEGSVPGLPEEAHQHIISADGESLLFTSAEGRLYLRRNLAQPQSPRNGQGHCTVAADACTVEVSASHRQVPDPNGFKPAKLEEAAPDASQVFFTSPSALTNDANTGISDGGRDLYLYDVRSEVLTDLTPDSADPNGAEVKEFLGAGADGSYAYFLANGELASNEGFDGTHAARGSCKEECNLYRWTSSDPGHLTYLGRFGFGPFSHEGFVEFDRRSTRVSQRGDVLLFKSPGRFTDYDSQGTPEFYRYSGATGQMTCVSCNPTGAAPEGAPTLRGLRGNGSNIAPAPVWSRNLSADGSRVFFETPDRLVTADINGEDGCSSAETGRVACLDVYEWEARGTGSCQSDSQDGGCIYLLSTGQSNEPSYLADASSTGDDVFIFTRQGLVGQDKDALVDLYDVRAGGGIAAQNPAIVSPCVSGEACKEAGRRPASPGSAATSEFRGPGNPVEKKHKKKHGKHMKKHGKHKNKKSDRGHKSKGGKGGGR